MANHVGRAHRRLPNPRLVKIHRNYSVEEAASLLGVHKNTVREWLRGGLPALTDQRPLLILGRELVAYLTRRRQANKRPCKPGEIYCVACRSPQKPAEGMAEYRPLTATGGNLAGICPKCNRMIYRRVSLARLPLDKGDLDITTTQERGHIGESSQPSVNRDFSKE